MTKTQPQVALAFVGSNLDEVGDDDPTVSLVRGRTRVQPQRWNPPLPVTTYRELWPEIARTRTRIR
jgi:hypothetical protein